MNRAGRTDHYCDVPMAAKKGFLPCGGRDCRSCTACIVISPDGKREHINCVGKKAENRHSY